MSVPNKERKRRRQRSVGDLPSKQRTRNGNVFRLWLEFAVTVAGCLLVDVAFVGGPTVSVARCHQCCAVPTIFSFIDYPFHPHHPLDQLKRPIRCCRHLAAVELLCFPNLLLGSIVIIVVVRVVVVLAGHSRSGFYTSRNVIFLQIAS